MIRSRFFNLIAAATLIVAAVSCLKENPSSEAEQGSAPDQDSVIAEFTASVEKHTVPASSSTPQPQQSSRTVIDGNGKVTWKAGDKVAFYWQINEEAHNGETDYPYVSDALETDGEGATLKISNASQKFVDVFVNGSTEGVEKRNLFAVYPHTATSSYFKESAEAPLDITIPAVQDGSFANASISIARWNATDLAKLSFKNFCALLKFNAEDDVRKIVIKSNSDIAGQMQITFKDGNITLAYPSIKTVMDGAKQITLDVPSAGTYYVAIRPTDIENLYIEYRGENNTFLGGSNAGDKFTAERSKIYEFKRENLVSNATDRLFVKVDGAGDGSSWDNAMNLDKLTSEMTTSESKKVYMAAGTYTFTTGMLVNATKNGFEIYGGYPANASGYDLTGRDLSTTIIDGGWEGTDDSTVNRRGFVVQAGEWVFDGLIFQNFRYSSTANGTAIQLITKNSTQKVGVDKPVSIRNCSFNMCTNVNGTHYGGALRIDELITVDMENCTFTSNKAQSGGAIYVAGNLNAKNCTFDANWATANNGGAIYGDTGADITMTSCVFNDNISKGSEADTGGGAIYSLSALTLNSCDFDSNKASKNGGAILLMGDAVAKLDKSTFRTNQANGTSSTNGGGAVYMNGNAKLYLNRCFLANNKDKYNAHHIYTRSTTNCVGINNSVIRAPWGEADADKLSLGSLIQVKGYTAIVNTTIYAKVASGGAISLGSKTKNGCRIINDIVINNFTDHNLSFYTTDYNVWAYNTIYNKKEIKSGKSGEYHFEACIENADPATNFPDANTLWTNNGTASAYEDGRGYYYYEWNGTTSLGTVQYNTLQDVKDLISGTAEIGADFLSWLESEDLKVKGVEALAVDIRGVARDTQKMWPGSYQGTLEASDANASAENFNIK